MNDFWWGMAALPIALFVFAFTLVRQGWAVAYRQYSRAYVGAENEARKARRGIWASEFAMPWDWRAANRRR